MLPIAAVRAYLQPVSFLSTTWKDNSGTSRFHCHRSYYPGFQILFVLKLEVTTYLFSVDGDTKMQHTAGVALGIVWYVLLVQKTCARIRHTNSYWFVFTYIEQYVLLYCNVVPLIMSA